MKFALIFVKIIAFILIFNILYISCNNLPKNTRLPHSVSESNTSKLTLLERQQQLQYYAIDFKFTKLKIEPITAHKLEGKLEYSITTPVDLFLTAYKNNTLVYFIEFPDPLYMRSVGDNEMQQKLDEELGTINVPGEFADEDYATHIYIYQLKAYIDDFEAHIISKTKMLELEKKYILKKRYEIQPKTLATFLNTD